MKINKKPGHKNNQINIAQGNIPQPIKNKLLALQPLYTKKENQQLNTFFTLLEAAYSTPEDFTTT